ncbi:MAG: ATP-binding protein [Actinomycetes bacterium]
MHHLDDPTEPHGDRSRDDRRHALARLAGRLARVGGWSYEPDTGEVFWSDETYDVLGFPTTDEPPGDVALTLYDPPDRDRVVRAIDRCAADGTPFDAEFSIVSARGAPMRVRVVGEAERDEDGRVRRVVGAFQDVTELRRAAAEMERMATIVDQASDAILIRDLEHRILHWNRRATHVLGWERDEVLGESVRELLYDGEGRVRFDEAHTALLEAGTWLGELEQITRDGVARTVAARWTLVHQPGEAPVVLSICTDVTGLREEEGMRLRAQRLESLGTLAGGIAHDLNNVLTPIGVAVDLLVDDETDPRRRDLLETVRTSARRGAEMIRSVLQFARGADGVREPVHAEALLDDVWGLLTETFPRNVTLEREVEPGLPPVLANRTQVHQVLLNLAVNARDALGPEGGRIRITARRAEQGQVALAVTDDGPGIAADTLERIFEPFFTTKEVGSGTGLGLSTSKGIIERHGGDMQVASTPGEGTTVSVVLPTTRSLRVHAPADPGRAPATAAGSVVLVVDDEEAIRTVTRHTLERAGYRVVEAANGAEALEVLRTWQPPVEAVVLDMTMPRLDGHATVPRVRDLAPQVPIIATSGVFGTASGRPPEGVAAVLPKPFSARSLLETLDRVLVGSGRQ